MYSSHRKSLGGVASHIVKVRKGNVAQVGISRMIEQKQDRGEDDGNLMIGMFLGDDDPVRSSRRGRDG